MLIDKRIPEEFILEKLVFNELVEYPHPLSTDVGFMFTVKNCEFVQVFFFNWDDKKKTISDIDVFLKEEYRHEKYLQAEIVKRLEEKKQSLIKQATQVLKDNKFASLHSLFM